MATVFLDPPDDLAALTLIDPEALAAFAQAVNDHRPSGRALVLMIATGGTLAMAEDKDGVRSPALRGQELMGQAESQLTKRFDVACFNAFFLDSSQMTYRHTRELAVVMTYLWRQVKVPFLGFLLTHGTDTMAYNGAALAMMMGPSLPFAVVMTGSQNPLEHPLSDAPCNLRHALYTLEAMSQQRKAGVVIAMGDVALAAVTASKVEDTKATAFAAPRHAPVADYRLLNYPIALSGLADAPEEGGFNPHIWVKDFSGTMLVQSRLGLNPSHVAAGAALAETKAVVLYSYASSTAHEPILEAIFLVARERGYPVFIVNSANGKFSEHYVSGHKAIGMGAIPLNMTLEAALAKIEVALALFPQTPDKIEAFMTTNYVGEIPPV